MELTPEQKEMVDGLNKSIAEQTEKIKALELKAEQTEAVKDEVETLKTWKEANELEVKALREAGENQGTIIKSLEDRLAEGNNELEDSVTKQLNKAIEANKEAFEAFKKGEQTTFEVNIKSPTLKAAGNISTGNISPNTINVVSTGMAPGYVDILGISPLVMDYCNKGKTNKSKLEWVEKVNRDGSVIFIGEGDPYTQIDFEWKKNTSDAKKVAPFIKVTDEMLDDVEFMSAAITGELKYQTILEASEGVLSGDGLGDNLKGITEYAQPYSRTDILTTTPNVYDCMKAMATQVKKNNGMASHVFIDPVDYTNMNISKGTTGFYVVIDGMVQMLPYLVIENNQIGVGNLLVADMSKSIVRIYKDFTVQFAWSGTDFENGFVTVRASMRLHHYIADNHTPCFCYDAISDVKTATTQP